MRVYYDRDADVGLPQGIAVPRKCLAPRPPEQANEREPIHELEVPHVC